MYRGFCALNSITVAMVVLSVSPLRSCGQPFQQVIDVPPDTIPDSAVIDSDTQVNVSAGGIVGSGIQFGKEDGTSTNVEVNITGGSAGNIDANRGSSINIFDGDISQIRLYPGTSAHITGGRLGRFDSRLGSITGEYATAVISGGIFSWPFVGREGVQLVGGEFILDGVPFAGGILTLTVASTPNSVLTGTLANGSVFIISPSRPDELHGSMISITSLPPIDTTPILIDEATDPIPPGLRAGQSLTLRDGGELPQDFAAVNATLNVEGGRVQEFLELAGSTVNVTGGIVERRLAAYRGTQLNVLGGLFQERPSIFDGALLNLDDGRMIGTRIEAGGSANVTGGVSQNYFLVEPGGSATLSGGRFDRFRAKAGSNVEISGGDFILNDVPIGSSTVTLTDTDVLTGTLGDGSPFIFSPQRDRNVVEGVMLTSIGLPPVPMETIVIDGSSGIFDQGLRKGQSLVLEVGGEIEWNVSIVDASLRINGGRVYEHLALSRSHLTMTHGRIESNFRVYSGSIVSICGGEFRQTRILDGGVVNLFGNDWEDSPVQAFPGSTFNIYGKSFSLGGQPIEGLIPGEAFEVQERETTLTGILADGSIYNQYLHTESQHSDYVDVAATLTVTLVLDGCEGCDVVTGTADDCNTNGLHDDCESDVDTDGFIDACDNCPNDSQPTQADFDGDGAGDACDDDIDNDGVPNAVDVCDFTPLGALVQQNGGLRADLDGDCDVDLIDFGILQSEFTGPGTGSP